MSLKMSMAIWGGIAAMMFGMLRNSFPIEWGGQVGLLAVIIAVSLPISLAFKKARLVKASDHP